MGLEHYEVDGAVEATSISILARVDHDGDVVGWEMAMSMISSPHSPGLAILARYVALRSGPLLGLQKPAGCWDCAAAS